MEEGRRVAYEGTGETAAREVTSASEIGERIAAILDAAEDSAERIRAEARAEAAEILHRAHERAAARVAELTHEPERLRDDAARVADETRAAAEAYSVETRTAADSYSADTRRTADEQARELVAAAQREVDSLRHEANEDVRRIEDEGRRRQEEMDAQLREVTRTRDSAIDNVRAAVAGLRDAAEQLETQVLPAAGGPTPPAPPPAPSRGWSRLLRREAAQPAPAAVASVPTPTDDLYARAKELGIRGRSKMTREELEEAIRVAQTPNGEPL